MRADDLLAEMATRRGLSIGLLKWRHDDPV